MKTFEEIEIAIDQAITDEKYEDVVLLLIYERSHMPGLPVSSDQLLQALNKHLKRREKPEFTMEDLKISLNLLKQEKLITDAT